MTSACSTPETHPADARTLAPDTGTRPGDSVEFEDFCEEIGGEWFEVYDAAFGISAGDPSGSETSCGDHPFEAWGYDPVSAAECLRDRESMACKEVFRGTLAPGETCEEVSVLAGLATFRPGVCQGACLEITRGCGFMCTPFQEEGQSCDRSQECAPGLSCSNQVEFSTVESIAGTCMAPTQERGGPCASNADCRGIFFPFCKNAVCTVLGGNLVGEPCSMHDECASSSCIDRVCVGYYRAEGEACSSACVDGTSCLQRDEDGIGTCTTPREIGEVCLDDRDCNGWSCDAGACAELRAGEGEVCSELVRCDDGLLCPFSWGAEGRICQLPASEGEDCGAGCSNGLACIWSRCETPRMLGEPCTQPLATGTTTLLNKYCERGLYCGPDATCTTLPRVQECASRDDCTETEYCSSTYCDDGPGHCWGRLCVPRSSVGERCEFNGECIEGYCTDEYTCAELIEDGEPCSRYDDDACASEACEVVGDNEIGRCASPPEC